MQSVQWLSEKWEKSSICQGDTVLIHSNLIHTMGMLKKNGFTPSVEVILDSFLDAVGATGTLLLPLFNFEFNTGVPFDIRSTPSHMGALTELARKKHDAVRTGHPVYSFAAIGRHSNMFADVNNYSGYGADSPFGLLRELDGKVAILNIDEQGSMTFYHHVEEMCQVNYRYFKEFTGQYIDATGVSSTRTYSIYVRDLERGVLTFLNPLGELLWQQGIYSGDRPNQGTGLRVTKAKEVFSFVSSIISENRALGHLYSLEK
jgi:aminoglycoside 3-N-acetyltransferase